MFTRSIEIDPTEGFLNSGNWPWLTVFSAGHALHVFVNGHLAGLMSFVTYSSDLSLFIVLFLSEVESFDCMQFPSQLVRKQFGVRSKTDVPSLAAHCYLRRFRSSNLFCRNCVWKFGKPKTNLQQWYKSESWREQDFSTKHRCWSPGLSLSPTPSFSIARAYDHTYACLSPYGSCLGLCSALK